MIPSIFRLSNGGYSGRSYGILSFLDDLLKEQTSLTKLFTMNISCISPPSDRNGRTLLNASAEEDCRLIPDCPLDPKSPLGVLVTFVMCWLVSSFVGLAQFPNNGFENWTDCEPDGWVSGNVCGLLEPITRSTTGHSGSFAARGEVIGFFGKNIAPVLQSGPDGTGFAISERFASVEGNYVFQPVGGDRFGVNVAFYKGGVVVAQGAVAIATAVSSYTPFKVTMNYVSQDIPDNAVIQILIVGPVTGIDYHLGSVMFVDGLSFGSGVSGAPPKLTIELSGNAVIVTWPPDAVGFKLQSTPSLNSRTWSDVAGLGAAHSYRFTPGSQEYFRLIKP